MGTLKHAKAKGSTLIDLRKMERMDLLILLTLVFSLLMLHPE
jgi:hypothetical protein